MTTGTCPLNQDRVAHTSPQIMYKAKGTRGKALSQKNEFMEAARNMMNPNAAMPRPEIRFKKVSFPL
ncbi:MAG: hypothetical protein QG577_287, partial [Thermodesulfobacteriota bacterium]|nr:hypothetical protein [Thermodesulfobacteriota bacterium]